MAAYEFQAQDASGKTSRGVIQGDSPKSVRSQLREKGLTPLEVSITIEGSAPDLGEQLFSAEHFARSLGERHQHFHNPRFERDFAVINNNQQSIWLNLQSTNVKLRDCCK